MLYLCINKLDHHWLGWWIFAIISTNVFLIGQLGTNTSEIWIKMYIQHQFSDAIIVKSQNAVYKMPTTFPRPQCVKQKPNKSGCEEFWHPTLTKNVLPTQWVDSEPIFSVCHFPSLVLFFKSGVFFLERPRKLEYICLRRESPRNHMSGLLLFWRSFKQVCNSLN